MGFLEWGLIAIIGIHILLDVIMAFYTRLAKKVDDYLLSKASVTFGANKETTIQTTIPEKKSCLRRLLSTIYYTINPYIYGLMRYRLICLGKIPSAHIRNFKYRAIYNMQITKNTVIYGGCEIRSPWNIHADRCVISTYCILDGRAGIFFDQDVVLGSGVHIWTEEHNINDSFFSVLPENRAPVHIGEHAWVCSDSTILPGVSIGEGCVIASRACVTHNTDSFSVYGGIPAKKIKQRNTDLRYKLNGKPTWHFF